jgi:hypothetical protein
MQRKRNAGSSLQPAGADDVGLVGGHDKLGPVADAELGHRPVDVGLAVAGLMYNRSAIWSLDRPSPTSASASRSRSVRTSSCLARPGSLALPA